MFRFTRHRDSAGKYCNPASHTCVCNCDQNAWSLHFAPRAIMATVVAASKCPMIAQWLCGVVTTCSVIYFSYTPQNLLLLCAWTATTTHYAHGRQRRCQEDPVGLPSGRLEKTTGSSLHHMAQHHPTGSETLPSYAPRSSRFGSEPPSVEDDVDVWRYAIASCMPETMTTTTESHLNSRAAGRCHS